MKATLILASLFAALAVATPITLDARDGIETVNPEGDAPMDIDSPSDEIESRAVVCLPPAFPFPIFHKHTLTPATQANIRVQLGDANQAGQANIPKNGKPVNIKGKFTVTVGDRASVVTGSGSCTLFKDANAQQKVVTVSSNGNEVKFGKTNFANGVIVCK